MKLSYILPQNDQGTEIAWIKIVGLVLDNSTKISGPANNRVGLFAINDACNPNETPYFLISFTSPPRSKNYLQFNQYIISDGAAYSHIVFLTNHRISVGTVNPYQLTMKIPSLQQVRDAIAASFR